MSFVTIIMIAKILKLDFPDLSTELIPVHE